MLASLSQSASSVTVSLILCLQNSDSFTSETTSKLKSLHLTGKDVHKPSGIPYSPLLLTPIDTILSPVPECQSLRWSTTALAAEKTELVPLTFRISPPRFWTVGMYSSSSQALPTIGSIGLPFTVMLLMQGYCVKEWLPKIYTPSTSLDLTPVLAVIWPTALLWSRRLRHVMFSGFTVEQWLRILAFVFAGFATTTHLTLGLAADSALAWAMKIPLFISNKSFLSMPFLRGKPPKKTITSASLNMSYGSSEQSTEISKGQEQSWISMVIPLRAPMAGVMSSNLSLRLKLPKMLPRRSWGMKEQAIWPAAPVMQTDSSFCIFINNPVQTISNRSDSSLITNRDVASIKKYLGVKSWEFITDLVINYYYKSCILNGPARCQL